LSVYPLSNRRQHEQHSTGDEYAGIQRLEAADAASSSRLMATACVAEFSSHLRGDYIALRSSDIFIEEPPFPRTVEDASIETHAAR